MANADANGQQIGANLQLKGGAAIVAPVSAFPNGLPANAIVVLPLPRPDETLIARLNEGPLVVTPEQMWPLLGFNGPAVQVQDDQGRPVAIGLEDLLGGLEKHWEEQPDDLNRARMLPPKSERGEPATHLGHNEGDLGAHPGGRRVAEGNNPDQPGRLVQWLYPRTPVMTWSVPGIWYDIGSKETLAEANRIFARR